MRELARRVFKWFLIGLGSVLAVVVIAGTVYEKVAESRDRARFPAPGRLVDVDGHAMHIHCQGQGGPTVVVEQGLGSMSVAWESIHRRIARITRICSYDRVGMGYSEPGHHPVRAVEVAQNLHKLLAGAGVDDDVVLVGWSAGGVYIREYYRQYPQRVKAMLFVDSSHEQQALRLPEPPGGSSGDATLKIAAYLAPLGLVRLSGVVESRFSEFPGPDTLKSHLIALYEQPHVIRALLNESDAFSLDIRQTGPSSLGDLPLIVLTQGKPVEILESMPANITLEHLQESRRVWNELQSELAALSSRSKHIIATESGHAIHSDQPELLIDAINELIRTVRNDAGLNRTGNTPAQA